MTEKIIIDGVDVRGCEFAESDIVDSKIQIICKNCKHRGDFIYGCQSNPNCYYKQLARKTEECEKLKEKLNPKLKNAHCVYFEGQTGLCRAKEFKRCNPVNCNLYTIDELSTILDLQAQLQAEQQKNEQLQKELEQALAQRDTYLACYKAKHGDLAKLYETEKLKLKAAEKQVIDCYMTSNMQCVLPTLSGFIKKYKQALE